MAGLSDMHIDWLHMPSLLLELSFLLLALALFWYARVLGGLLEIIRRPPLEVLVGIAGWVVIIAVVIPDFIANAIFSPNTSAFADAYQYFWLLHSLSFFGLLIAALLVLYPSVSYYLWRNNEWGRVQSGKCGTSASAKCKVFNSERRADQAGRLFLPQAIARRSSLHNFDL